MQSHLEKIEDQIENIFDAALNAYTYCYYMISQRKNFVAALICKDLLEKIKEEFGRIIRSEDKFKLLGDDPEILERRAKIDRKAEDVKRAINTIKSSFTNIGYVPID